jgi:hypothetical protein
MQTERELSGGGVLVLAYLLYNAPRERTIRWWCAGANNVPEDGSRPLVYSRRTRRVVSIDVAKRTRHESDPGRTRRGRVSRIA